MRAHACARAPAQWLRCGQDACPPDAHAAVLQGNVEDFLMRSDRGFAAPDVSFQLRLDMDPQLAAIQHITMAEGPRGPHGAAGASQADAMDGHASEPSGGAGAASKPKQEAAASAGALSAHASSAAADAPDSAGGGGERPASTEGPDHAVSGESGGEGRGEGKAEGAERLGAPGRARGAGGGGKQPQVEKTQIHTFSPGVSGRQRSRQPFSNVSLDAKRHKVMLAAQGRIYIHTRRTYK